MISTFRQGNVFFDGIFAGVIAETEKGYSFSYAASYLSGPVPHPVSLTLPLQGEAFTSTVFFPFFDGLIPEGWLLEISLETWKLNPRDRMGLLLATCKDSIGAVSVEAI
ncbi:HipA domain-containing protein [Sphaerochaeta pleomorpha str. Grapes]|uniref:HipA domain-containing protein n=1 Tax=Sphaerochaeta pleomorpha (strain ATCC BAA-1885 / DSM 22778 / Grapes) TaxID=158190 RepID=G8QRF5_SPHPG|nr:HipA N-terminal domain-containing protein [Sphaerochaeta pleomorpha]AEV28808.1 HipA domain-containing protein [Sphaerochaeta pleomorpha str. Grapes]